MAATHELWSWDQSSSQWLAIDQGKLLDMEAGAKRRYDTVRKHDLPDSAFIVTPKGRGPTETPHQLGLMVVAKLATLPPVSDSAVELHWVVGRVGESEKSIARFATQDDAAAFIGSVLATRDPDGVAAGGYYLDGPADD